MVKKYQKMLIKSPIIITIERIIILPKVQKKLAKTLLFVLVISFSIIIAGIET